MSQTTRLLIIVALFWFAQYIYMPFTTPFLLAQKVSADLVGVVIGIYGGIQMLLRFPLGIGADLIGKHKPWIVIGCLCSGLASIIRCIEPSGEGFLVANCLSGLASSMWMSFMLLYTQGLSPNRLQQGMGYIFAANNGGIGAAFVGSALLYESCGMLTLCVLSSISGLLSCILSLGLLEKSNTTNSSQKHSHQKTSCTESAVANDISESNASEASHSANTSNSSVPSNNSISLHDSESTPPTATVRSSEASLSKNAVHTSEPSLRTAAAHTSESSLSTNVVHTSKPYLSTTEHNDSKQEMISTSFNASKPTFNTSKPSLISLLGVTKNPVLWFFAFICTIQQGVIMGTVMSFSNEAAHRIGGSDLQVGIMTVVYISSCIISCYLSASAWSIKLGPALPMTLTQVLMAGYCFMMPSLDNIYVMIFMQVLIGVSGGFVFVWANTEALQGVDKSKRASALGLFQSIFAFGMTFVPIIAGLIIEYSNGSLKAAFYAQCALAIFGAAATSAFYIRRAKLKKTGAFS